MCSYRSKRVVYWIKMAFDLSFVTKKDNTIKISGGEKEHE